VDISSGVIHRGVPLCGGGHLAHRPAGRARAQSIVELRGCPRMIVSDNGTELTSNAILRWQQEHGVKWH